MSKKKEMINHPDHYNQHPTGVECIDIIEHMPFNVGTAIKHLWRCDHKHPDPDEDLGKAEWYIQRERDRRRRIAEGGKHCPSLGVRKPGDKK